MSLLLPLNGVALAVDPSQQPLDDLLRVLRAEKAPIGAWLAAAHGLLACGREADYEALLSEAVERETQPGGPEVFANVQALCSLAEFTLQQAAAERDRRQRTVLLSRSTELCHRAQRLSLVTGAEEQLPELVLGHAALVRGDITSARKGFEKALRLRSNGRASVAAQLALAALHFGQKNFLEALRLYKAALRACPTCPPEVRLGIAACCLRLGSTVKAEAAYKRVLELEPDCTPALLGLAVLKLHVSNEEEGVLEGSVLLAQAFEQDPENPFVLLLLSHFCLRQGIPHKARQLAEVVLAHGGSPALQGEALTILARSCHALQQFNEAYRYYQQAAQLDPKLPLPRLGLAQLSVLQGAEGNAVTLLESVLTDAPQWIDALEVLGRVYPKAARKAGSAKVVGQFKEAAAQRPSNAELWELLGDLLASLEPAGALKAYDKAIEIRRKALASSPSSGGSGSIAKLPTRLLNNAAVLHLRAGNSQLAFELMAAAVAAAAGAPASELDPLTQVTLGYNLARVKEACGDLKAAEAEYRELLHQFPQYGDCCLRLACIAKARGDTKEALQWTEQAVANPAYACDGLALQAGLYLEKRDYHHAKQVLDKLLEREEGGRHEAFGKLALANLHAYSAPSTRKQDKDRQRVEQHYSHAMELYRRVLEKDEGCISAANGIGCILAELGNLPAAKEVFLQVQEASSASAGFWRMPDAWVNLANVYLAQEQYTPAIQMYQNALRRFYDNRSAVVMLYLARAQYDADQLPQAKRTLTKALHLAPTDNNLRFDIGVTMQEWAVRTLKQPRPAGDPAKHDAFRRAVRDLENAYRFFQHLHDQGKASGLDPRKLKEHINFIAGTHKGALDLVAQAAKEAEDTRKRQEAASKLAEAEQMQRMVVEKEKQQEQDARKKQLEEQARERQERLKVLQEQWRNQALTAKAVEKGDAAAEAKRAKEAAEAAENARVDALFEESEEDEDYNPEADEEGQAALAADAAARGGRGAGSAAPAAAAAAAGAQQEQGAAADAAPAAGPVEGYEDLEDDMEDEDDLFGDGPGGGLEGSEEEGGGGGGAPAERPAKRHKAVLSDDEDEDE